MGTSYQLGNLVSSASATIEATIGERFPLPPKGKTPRYEYGKVMCIFMGCVYAYVIILALVGPENFKKRFEVEYDTDMERAVGHEAIEKVIHHRSPEGSENGVRHEPVQV